MVSKASDIQDAATPNRPCDSPSPRPPFGSWPTSTSNATASAASSSPAASASSATATWQASARRCCRPRSTRRDGTEPALRYVLGRNEQAMVHTAAAYARQKDRLQAWAVTASIGPGSTNMLTGAALATINRLPVLLLPVRHVRHPGQRARAAGTRAAVTTARSPSTTRSSRCRGSSTGCGAPNSCPPRCSARCGCSPTPSRPARRPIALPQDVQAEAFDWPESLFAERTWHVARPRARALGDRRAPPR